MLYNLANPHDVELFHRRADQLIANGSVIELVSKKQRSSNQNRYLHLLIGYLAIEVGCTLDYVKEQYFKRLANRDLFVSKRADKWAGEVEVLRSSADLSTEEMTVAINRFKDWSAQVAGVALPEATDQQWLAAIEVEISRFRQYL